MARSKPEQYRHLKLQLQARNSYSIRDSSAATIKACEHFRWCAVTDLFEWRDDRVHQRQRQPMHFAQWH